MKKEYIAPAIKIIPMEPISFLASSGKRDYDTNVPDLDYGGDTTPSDPDNPDEFESLSKDGIWDDSFME